MKKIIWVALKCFQFNHLKKNKVEQQIESQALLTKKKRKLQKYDTNNTNKQKTDFSLFHAKKNDQLQMRKKKGLYYSQLNKCPL